MAAPGLGSQSGSQPKAIFVYLRNWFYGQSDREERTLEKYTTTTIQMKIIDKDFGRNIIVSIGSCKMYLRVTYVVLIMLFIHCNFS